MPPRLLRSPLTWVVAAVLVAAAVFGGYWFQPWKLVVDQTVAERLTDPVPGEPAGTPSAGAGPTSPSSPPTPAPSTPAPSGGGSARPVLVSSGGFITHEHRTSGTARIVRDPTGTDLDRLRSVSIWCRRFAVSFGAAELRPVG